MDSSYLKQILIYILTTLLCIGFVAFVVYHVVISANTDLEVTPVVYSTQEDARVFDAYIFRSETLVYTTTPNSEGGINHLKEDGAKVAVGEAICSVFPASSNEETIQRIKELDRTIELLKNSNIEENVSYSDTQIIDESIYNSYYTILDSISADNAGYAMAKTDGLISSLNQRLIITRRVENFNRQIEQYEAERNRLIGAGGEVAETVYAPKSGYYYADIDGFENVFSVDRIQHMTLDEFDDILSHQFSASLRYNEKGGVNCGKIVTEFNWYLGCKVSTEESRNFTEGFTYTVIFPYNSDVRISMILDRMILQADDDRVALFFRTNVIPENFNFLRRQSVDIVVESYVGYKVPISAVRIVNGVQGVYVLEGYVVEFREIKPIQEINGFFICEENDGSPEKKGQLALYDRIIISGRNLYEGKIIS